jgi:uncharacterized protein YecE (DUF72 family)/predicted nuclease of predicted toxin-antitoxin system
MKFLTDQDVYAVTIRFLTGWGHDVVTAAQLSLPRAEDAQLLRVAHQEGRIFVTRDRDFGGLVFVQGGGTGVIYLRISRSTVNAVHAELERVLALYFEQELRSSFLVVEPGRHRIRRLAQSGRPRAIGEQETLPAGFGKRAPPMNLYVGTSGYSYKEWKGTFYPKDLSEKKMLHYYGERFRTVEINNTFYRMPKASVLEAWAAEVPADFKFVLKASQRITHMQRLKDADDSVRYLLEVAATLKDRLGPLLFQLPPNLKKDVPRLRDFLALLPSERRAAFEFRHQSWFDDEVFALLRQNQAALCIAEAEGDLQVPFVSTADWGYLRLRMPDYTDADLKTWLKRVQEQSWKDTFVFFKHEDEGKGPQMAKRFLDLAG